jgi:glycosyltransferase involved in cell wall biosynthesis
MKEKRLRIGFVSTRFSGTDGVSLETEKWVNILERLGHRCFYFAGESDRPAGTTHLVPEAHFKHPSVEALTAELFMATKRSRLTSQMVQSLKDHLKAHIEEFVGQFMLDLLIVENALSLPVNIPLGLALTEFIAAENFPTIAHHHDFGWERKRFAIGVAGDYLRTAFPPYLPSIRHVVINSFAARQLALRTGASSMLIPNVMDFESPPPPPDELTKTMRGALGLAERDHILLQPTRVVPRKRIELAIELTRRLDSGCVLIVSHAAGDEGSAYEKHLRDYAELIGVRVIFASKEFGLERRLDEDGTQVFSLSDAYSHADLVTYPSTVEGFGNAFLETIYHRRPIVISTYEIFKTDIQPKGFRVIGFDDFISDYTVGQALAVLQDTGMAAEMAEHNYNLGRRFYSFQTLERNLYNLLGETVGM